MKYKGYTHLENEIDLHTSNDWRGMLFATIVAIVLALLIVSIVDRLSGYQLHNWVADAFISLMTGGV